MKQFKFEYAATSHVDSSEFTSVQSKLEHEIGHIKKALQEKNYDTHYSSVYLPHDQQLFDHVKSVIKEKQAVSPTAMVVIGIGGSSLGALSVHEALNGALYNEHHPLNRVYFAETVDTDSIASIRSLLEVELQKGNAILLNVISKSGKTTETIANFQVFLALLKQYRPDDWQQLVVATTDEGSPLSNWATGAGCTTLAIPAKVGGRYSVFSAVGLFPLGMLGIDLDQLRAGARDILKNCTNSDIRENYAAAGAAIRYSLYQRGYTINDLFLFDPSLETLGKWNRQLVAESLGKKHTIAGKLVEVGITPTVSIGSTDLHSTGQLYLGGPRNKLTTFVTVQEQAERIGIPDWPEFDSLVPHLQGKSLQTIMDAIANATKFVFQEDERPFISIAFGQKSAYAIGQFMQYKMAETIYLGL